MVSAQPVSRTARTINDKKPDWVIKIIKDKVKKYISHHRKTPSVSFFGLSFKPDIDDFRGSPALYIVNQMEKENFDVYVVEPNIEKIDNLNIINIETAISETDILVFLVKHKEFIKAIKDNSFNSNTILDFCGVSQNLT